MFHVEEADHRYTNEFAPTSHRYAPTTDENCSSGVHTNAPVAVRVRFLADDIKPDANGMYSAAPEDTPDHPSDRHALTSTLSPAAVREDATCGIYGMGLNTNVCDLFPKGSLS